MGASLLILTCVDDAMAWLRQQGVKSLTVNSRAVADQARQGVGFIAWPGAARDGRAFVAQALQDGARACLVEADGAQAFVFGDARVAAFKGLKAASAEIAHGFYNEPSAQLDVVAVTGTNGKTSTSWWTAQALSAVGRRCGVIGTLGVGQPGGGDLMPTGLTTPDPITLHATFRQFVDQGWQAVAIEASSIGIEEQRLGATRISVAQFTNFTQDHLDYHGSMAAYWEAKRALFDWPGLRAAVVNLDDPAGGSLADGVSARGLDLWTYGLVHTARLQATGLTHHADGMGFTLVERDADLDATVDHVEVNTHLVGEFNASNLLAVIGALRALGVSLSQAVAACENLTPVPGRMQRVALPHVAPEGQPVVVVDYAHTPDALKKALCALSPMAKARGGQLWCVFGCGGNRDPIKRPLMGAIAEQFADHLVLTSDNPRDEKPCFILSQILAGIARHDDVDVLDDRAEAIADAISRCDPKDVVLIAGKGHETMQEVAGVKTPFSDTDQATQALVRRFGAPVQGSAPMMTLGLAQQLLPGSTLSGDPATPLLRAHTDTRTLQQGDLFVALRGERFDAHDFLPQAREAGAVAALVQRGLDSSGLPGLTVSDTRAALGWLASGWRSRFDIPLIAVTGSNGKTTVTQMIASILQAWVAEQGLPDAALSTQGNYNNEIGVPLTLLRLRQGQHRCAVVELGMNHPGEIAQLSAIAAPTVALVNNAQREHQEFMHTVEAVARENGAVLQALSRGGVAVFPADDEHAPIWRELANGCHVIDFAAEGPAAVTGQATWQAQPSPHWVIALRTPAGQASVKLPMAGAHNVRNALAATASALAAGASLTAVVTGLQAFEPVKGRSQLHGIQRQGRDVTLIDDSYNANPDSVLAAIDMLAGLPGPQWLVLGDMGEVGNQGPSFHEEAGRYARERGIEQFWTAGTLCAHAAQAFGPSAQHFDSAADIVAALNAKTGAPEAASVLVKGSRFMKMEQVVAVLLGGAHAA
ncbi:bifunctional UDP-N-acetylmuramoyl-L-alanyl-D-glutamate--2,6-diaminopimelate ligase MurE/UDP-N-acetylmuramoyl-tripeptide--D-alanyl-D-alanine ligase MurF [Aquabacterium sp.]|uniref:bifunctional UDP-N-acetylmuramoyl-L-alanyl-D-glutamate--2, 6-diaminopimelate ligase MurE/UDP-N-acetylmuramoyl-tripeptide--D-alanyl-D-alanine ligase MurF n=1 Tax=Aquabacterium sp. TaxID=1872578 RepID=UPI0019986AF3|nr:bifunctional UDP-N-acetylmuramoyl-L-alanyl-D-glutamate--2,6-diaminopimelate ligase MurE/UDP-N-acetylmuramoyl-tripeptide--D-alanyl-D-alanine ligase MurF [Aquabacterium sp.]MBC7701708.1 bifunctional UDP-N-acetylmuramoyl-L-alanyl-D-glutamate--2,6-diaminopimelate ligase MurE/UDP-N-acetylmuramoyl-tripeptide--D-alanyl-D-alanine ligase MurF [Aquabacterium sp.]